MLGTVNPAYDIVTTLIHADSVLSKRIRDWLVGRTEDTIVNTVYGGALPPPPPMAPPGAPQTTSQMTVPNLWTQQDAINASMDTSRVQWNSFFSNVAASNANSIGGWGIPDWVYVTGLGVVAFIIIGGDTVKRRYL